MGKYFVTDGFRGEANKQLTVEHAFKVGRFIGWYYGAAKDKSCKVVIGKATEAAQALDSENVRCRDPEDQKFLILTKAAANICGVGSTALITRDKLLRKAAKKLRAAERGGAMLLLPEDFTE